MKIGHEVAKAYFSEPSFNQNAAVLAQIVNEQVEELLAEKEAERAWAAGAARQKEQVSA